VISVLRPFVVIASSRPVNKNASTGAVVRGQGRAFILNRSLCAGKCYVTTYSE